MQEGQLLQAALSEYKDLLATNTAKSGASIDAEKLADALRDEHDWTDNGGAHAIVSLANNYGVFMLRNALALAIVLGKENGELGF